MGHRWLLARELLKRRHMTDRATRHPILRVHLVFHRVQPERHRHGYIQKATAHATDNQAIAPFDHALLLGRMGLSHLVHRLAMRRQHVLERLAHELTAAVRVNAAYREWNLGGANITGDAHKEVTEDGRDLILGPKAKHQHESREVVNHQHEILLLDNEEALIRAFRLDPVQGGARLAFGIGHLARLAEAACRFPRKCHALGAATEFPP
ncbi:hypothetical protein BC831DRAFT_452374 [Entophlyctis helioformis]|nr:hypothetical protein BC831DRAFT_452374 [Entophlyctis helioformis]